MRTARLKVMSLPVGTESSATIELLLIEVLRFYSAQSICFREG